MYVCICRAVTESEIQRAIARGAQSVRALRDELGIVDDCGRCAQCALECLSDTKHSPASCEAECPQTLVPDQPHPALQMVGVGKLVEGRR